VIIVLVLVALALTVVAAVEALPVLIAGLALILAGTFLTLAWMCYRYAWQPARRANARAINADVLNTVTRRPVPVVPVERPQHPEAYGLDPDDDLPPVPTDRSTRP
jgi:cytochrome oxidase assembly protein ShyY1